MADANSRSIWKTGCAERQTPPLEAVSLPPPTQPTHLPVPPPSFTKRTRKHVFSWSLHGRPLGPRQDIAQMGEPELQTLLAQNNQLLADKSLAKNLPDGGQKIRHTNLAIEGRLRALQSRTTSTKTTLPTTATADAPLDRAMGNLHLTRDAQPTSPTVRTGSKPAAGRRIKALSIAEAIDLEQAHRRQLREAELEASLQRIADMSLEERAQQHGASSMAWSEDEAQDLEESDGQYDDEIAFMNAEADTLRRQLEPTH
ncbi:hypothetical protein H4R34_003125 [Dimargaris verticillata]|uniref:Uncharacterized protein n=1 Tax=Dimargaris verticillata TaxID=2761393 RepID=A0A9W8B6N8_9FUNG|nr:hypothetical protein H4R34_003125 [Dimargaris verticillata]